MKYTSMKKQQGAALGVGLILLVIITLMGYTGMKGTMLQEKMAAGLHNRTLAAGGANSALREGEWFLYNLVKETNGVNIQGTPDGEFNGIYSYLEKPNESDSEVNPVVTKFKKRNWISQKGTVLDGFTQDIDHINAKLKNNPQYLIYELKNAVSGFNDVNSQEFGVGRGRISGSSSQFRAFAVIGKSDSGDGKTFSLLQSTYTAIVSSDATN